MLDARYDWQVDGLPVQQGFAELGDVSCGIEVSVEAEPTLLTLEYVSVSVSSFDVPADATFLAGVPWVYEDDVLSEGFRFIGEKSLELAEAPVSEKSVESPSVCLRSLYFQVFQSEGVRVRLNNTFAKAVVDVSDKPVFPPAETFQMSLCGTGAFRLETAFQPLVFSLHSPYLAAVEELTVTGDYGIGNSPVNTENVVRFNGMGRFGFGVEVQKYLAVFVTQSCARDGPPGITFEVSWDVNWDLEPSIYGRKGNDSFFESGSKRSGVVAYPAEGFFHGQYFQSFPFQHIGSLITSRANEAGLEERKLLPDFFVCKVVNFEFVESPCLKCFF